MAVIHIEEIQKLAYAKAGNEVEAGEFFLEIRFDNPERRSSVVDEEMKNRVITADSAYGIVTIQFDESGELKSLDFS